MYQHSCARECQRTGDARVRNAWAARQDAEKHLTPSHKDAKVKRFEAGSSDLLGQHHFKDPREVAINPPF